MDGRVVVDDWDDAAKLAWDHLASYATQLELRPQEQQFDPALTPDPLGIAQRRRWAAERTPTTAVAEAIARHPGVTVQELAVALNPPLGRHELDPALNRVRTALTRLAKLGLLVRRKDALGVTRHYVVETAPRPDDPRYATDAAVLACRALEAALQGAGLQPPSHSWLVDTVRRLRYTLQPPAGDGAGSHPLVEAMGRRGATSSPADPLAEAADPDDEVLDSLGEVTTK